MGEGDHCNGVASIPIWSFCVQGCQKASVSSATTRVWRRNRQLNTWTEPSRPGLSSQSRSSSLTVRRHWRRVPLLQEQRTMVLTFQRLSPHHLTSPPPQPPQPHHGGCSDSYITLPPGKSGKLYTIVRSRIRFLSFLKMQKNATFLRFLKWHFRRKKT